MSRRLLPHEVHVSTWIQASELRVYAGAFIQHLFAQGYRRSTILPYRASVAHFAHWMTVHKIQVRHLNESLIGRFLAEHIPVCRCGSGDSDGRTRSERD